MVSVFCLRPSISCGRKYEILKIERIKAITVIVDSASRVLLLPQDVEYQRLETTSAVYIVNISGLNDPLIFYKIFSTCLYRFFQLQLILFCYWANNLIFSFVENQPFTLKVDANVFLLDLMP